MANDLKETPNLAEQLPEAHLSLSVGFKAIHQMETEYLHSRLIGTAKMEKINHERIFLGAGCSPSIAV